MASWQGNSIAEPSSQIEITKALSKMHHGSIWQHGQQIERDKLEQAVSLCPQMFAGRILSVKHNIMLTTSIADPPRPQQVRFKSGSDCACQLCTRARFLQRVPSWQKSEVEILEHRCCTTYFMGLTRHSIDPLGFSRKQDDLGSETDGLITSINLTAIAGIQLRNPKILSSVLRQPQQELPQAIEWVASQIPLMHRLFIQPLMASATWGLVTSMRASLMTSRAMHGERCFSRQAAVLQRPEKRSRKTCQPEIRDRRMAEMKNSLRIVAPSKL